MRYRFIHSIIKKFEDLRYAKYLWGEKVIMGDTIMKTRIIWYNLWYVCFCNSIFKISRIMALEPGNFSFDEGGDSIVLACHKHNEMCIEKEKNCWKKLKDYYYKTSDKFIKVTSQQEEQWKKVFFTHSFAISSLGRVLNLSTGKIKNAKSGQYIRCKINKTYYYIHRLVAAAFIENKTPLIRRWVNHIDGNKKNNAVSNLEWVTPKENTEHAIAKGLIKN